MKARHPSAHASAIGRSLAALLATAGLAISASGEPVGFVAGVEGEVEMLPSGQLSWEAALIDRDVEIGDTVRTGLDAAIKIVLVDDTVLSLGEDTEIVIDSFVVGANATRDRSVLRHLKGQIRTRVGEAFGGTTRVEVHTPTAVMGVKGTVFTSRIGSAENGEPVTLGCTWEGGVFMHLLGDSGNKVDIPLDRCRQATATAIGSPTLPPSNFTPVKQPAQQGMGGTVQAMLMGSGSTYLAEWLVEPPPVSANEGMDVNPLGGTNPTDPVLEGPEDAASLTSTPPDGLGPDGGFVFNDQPTVDTPPEPN